MMREVPSVVNIYILRTYLFSISSLNNVRHKGHVMFLIFGAFQELIFQAIETFQSKETIVRQFHIFMGHRQGHFKVTVTILYYSLTQNIIKPHILLRQRTLTDILNISVHYLN